MRHHRTARGGETDGAALVASRVASFTQGGHFSGTEISPKNRSAALTCRRSQKLRIDAARKIESIREKCRPSRAEEDIIISSSRGDLRTRHIDS
jgi:hypothetical protein